MVDDGGCDHNTVHENLSGAIRVANEQLPDVTLCIVTLMTMSILESAPTEQLCVTGGVGQVRGNNWLVHACQYLTMRIYLKQAFRK